MKYKIHGNGFFKIDLGDSIINIYDKSIPRQNVPTDIHDHRFSFKSTILTGCLIHEIFQVGLDLFPQAPKDWFDMPNLSKWYHIYKPDSGYNTPEKPDLAINTGEVVKLECIDIQILHPGDTYFFNTKQIHRVRQRDNPTITKLQKLHVDKDYLPRIFVPYGHKPDYDFDNSERTIQ